MQENYNVRQTAEMLGVKTRTVREWITQGKIHGFKYGISNRWFVSSEEMERLKSEVTDGYKH